MNSRGSFNNDQSKQFVEGFLSLRRVTRTYAKVFLRRMNKYLTKLVIIKGKLKQVNIKRLDLQLLR